MTINFCSMLPLCHRLAASGKVYLSIKIKGLFITKLHLHNPDRELENRISIKILKSFYIKKINNVLRDFFQNVRIYQHQFFKRCPLKLFHT